MPLISALINADKLAGGTKKTDELANLIQDNNSGGGGVSAGQTNNSGGTTLGGASLGSAKPKAGQTNYSGGITLGRDSTISSGLKTDASTPSDAERRAQEEAARRAQQEAEAQALAEQAARREAQLAERRAQEEAARQAADNLIEQPPAAPKQNKPQSQSPASQPPASQTSIESILDEEETPVYQPSPEELLELDTARKTDVTGNYNPRSYVDTNRAPDRTMPTVSNTGLQASMPPATPRSVVDNSNTREIVNDAENPSELYDDWRYLLSQRREAEESASAPVSAETLIDAGPQFGGFYNPLYPNGAGTKGRQDPYGAIRRYQGMNGVSDAALQNNDVITGAWNDVMGGLVIPSRPDVPVTDVVPIGSSSAAATYPINQMTEAEARAMEAQYRMNLANGGNAVPLGAGITPQYGDWRDNIQLPDPVLNRETVNRPADRDLPTVPNIGLVPYTPLQEGVDVFAEAQRHLEERNKPQGESATPVSRLQKDYETRANDDPFWYYYDQALGVGADPGQAADYANSVINSQQNSPGAFYDTIADLYNASESDGWLMKQVSDLYGNLPKIDPESPMAAEREQERLDRLADLVRQIQADDELVDDRPEITGQQVKDKFDESHASARETTDALLDFARNVTTPTSDAIDNFLNTDNTPYDDVVKQAQESAIAAGYMPGTSAYENYVNDIVKQNMPADTSEGANGTARNADHWFRPEDADRSKYATDLYNDMLRAQNNSEFGDLIDKYPDSFNYNERTGEWEKTNNNFLSQEDSGNWYDENAGTRLYADEAEQKLYDDYRKQGMTDYIAKTSVIDPDRWVWNENLGMWQDTNMPENLKWSSFDAERLMDDLAAMNAPGADKDGNLNMAAQALFLGLTDEGLPNEYADFYDYRGRNLHQAIDPITKLPVGNPYMIPELRTVVDPATGEVTYGFEEANPNDPNHGLTKEQKLHLFDQGGAFRNSASGVTDNYLFDSLLATNPAYALGSPLTESAGQMTAEQFLAAYNAFLQANPLIQVMVGAGLLTEQDVLDNFFRDVELTAGPGSGSGSGGSGGYRSGYKRYTGGHSYGGSRNRSGSWSGSSGSGGSGYTPRVSVSTPNLYSSSSSNYGGYANRNANAYADYTNPRSNKIPVVKNQQEQRVYNIMRNWSF